MPKTKPTPQTISAFCGYCRDHDAEIILPDGSLCCKPCAAKQGLQIEWKISSVRLKKIYAASEEKLCKKITLWQFAALLGIETSTKSSAANYVSRMLRGESTISASISEEAIKIEQLHEKDIDFLISQSDMKGSST